MGILSDFLKVGGPVIGIGYGAAAEMYDRANIKAGDQQLLFQGLGTDLRQERSVNNKMLNEKLSNFRSDSVSIRECFLLMLVPTREMYPISPGRHN